MGSVTTAKARWHEPLGFNDQGTQFTGSAFGAMLNLGGHNWVDEIRRLVQRRTSAPSSEKSNVESVPHQLSERRGDSIAS